MAGLSVVWLCYFAYRQGLIYCAGLAMFFDFDYYRKVLVHVWGLKAWPGRRRMLLRLLVVVPLTSLFHACCFILDYLFFPQLLWLEVKQPVFIVGHARSGTTLMHRLLSADGERFSYFLYWETFFPSLLQKKCIRGLGWLDQHYFGGRIKRRLVVWDDKTFGPYRHMHDMSLWNSEEDQFVMKAAFVTQQWSLDIPIMDKIDIFHLDQMPLRRRLRWTGHYRECVKRQLLLNGKHKIHLSKNPVMSGWVGALLEAFPDARFIVMMRNPAQCMPSVLKLVESTWRGKGWSREDYAASQRVLTDISFDTFRNPATILASRPDIRQIVVDYRKLTSAPRETTLAVYRALDMQVSAEFDAWLQIEDGSAKAHQSRFEYSIDDYDLSVERIESELSSFYDRYQWPRLANSGK